MGIVAQIYNPNTGVEAGGLQIQSKLFSVFKKKIKNYNKESTHFKFGRDRLFRKKNIATCALWKQFMKFLFS